MDHSVRAIVTAYDDLGRVNLVTSYSTNNSQNWDSSHIVNQINDWYNGWGQVAREYQEHDGSIDTNTPFIAYTYGDGAATDSNVAKYVRLTDVIYPNTPSPRDVSYGYGTTGAIDDIMSRLETIGSTSGSEIDAKYTYLGAGTIVKTAHPQVSDELNLDYGIANNAFGGFDRFGRVVDEVWKNSSGTVLDGYKYGYDRAGDLWWKTNLEPNATDLDELYTYDDLGRLINTQRGELDVTTDPSNPAFTDTPTKTQGWTLDGQGNFSQFDDNGTTQTRTADAANEIATINGVATTTYDTAGNMTSDGTLNYKYDAWNRLVEVTTMVGETERTVAEYKYDGANHRVEKTVYDLSIGDPTATTDYFYNQQWQVVEERMLPAGENQSTVVTQYVWDQSYIDTPVVRFRGSETLYYTTDANHNVTSLVDPAGEVVERYVYDAYGKVTFCGGLWTPLTTGGNNSTTRSGVSSAYVNEVLYCGYRYDPETSLVISTTVATAGNYQDRNRELITTLSTFDVRDPIGIAGGINLYEYCGDDPAIFTDPSGEKHVKTYRPKASECMVVIFIGHTTDSQTLAEQAGKQARRANVKCYAEGVIACAEALGDVILPIPSQYKIPDWPGTRWTLRFDQVDYMVAAIDFALKMLVYAKSWCDEPCNCKTITLRIVCDADAAWALGQYGKTTQVPLLNTSADKLPGDDLPTQRPSKDRWGRLGRWVNDFTIDCKSVKKQCPIGGPPHVHDPT